MKRFRKQYSRPRKPWDKERIQRESKLLDSFGLRRKREIWRAESILRDFRRRARALAGQKNEEQEKALLNRVSSLGLVDKTSDLDDVLALDINKILDRRLQTIVFRKGLAYSLKQARQFIVHGHIVLDGRRIKWPSALITVNEESKLKLHSKSKLKDWVIKEKKEISKNELFKKVQSKQKKPKPAKKDKPDKAIEEQKEESEKKEVKKKSKASTKKEPVEAEEKPKEEKKEVSKPSDEETAEESKSESSDTENNEVEKS